VTTCSSLPELRESVTNVLILKCRTGFGLRDSPNIERIPSDFAPLTAPLVQQQTTGLRQHRTCSRKLDGISESKLDLVVLPLGTVCKRLPKKPPHMARHARRAPEPSVVVSIAAVVRGANGMSTMQLTSKDHVLNDLSLTLRSCNRLDKACVPTPTKRRLRPDNVRAGRVSKSPVVPGASRIERKLDDLVTMLSSKSADASSSVARPPIQEKEAPSLVPQCPELTESEADEGLATFEAHMFKFFPFVYIPPNTTASKLRSQRPFLVLCMAAISNKQAERQRGLFGMMRATIAQKLVITVEPSIDLLLGLLTFLGW
jgi:hypothetical protein